MYDGSAKDPGPQYSQDDVSVQGAPHLLHAYYAARQETLEWQTSPEVGILFIPC